MTKRFFLYYLLCFLAVNVYSQTTYYYKLTNIHNNKTSLKIQGGQFITFIGDICYESDKKGIGVGHGTMTYNPNYSTSSVKKYMGKSYWSNDAVYAFNTDKSVLNVVLEDEMIMVYKRATPPEGVFTCSLIRQQNSYSSGRTDNSFDPYHPLPDPMPEIQYNPQPNPNPNSTVESHLTAAQYQHIYNGYEDVAKGVFESFRIVPDMKTGPRMQNMQTLRDTQNSMRILRQEAANYGITIQQSYYETASPH